MSILFQQDFDNIHVSFYRNMKSHVVEKMIISRVMRGICSDYYKDVVHGLLNRQENTVFPNIYRDVIKNEIKEEWKLPEELVEQLAKSRFEQLRWRLRAGGGRHPWISGKISHIVLRAGCPPGRH